MSVLPIVIVGDPVLHSPTTPVELDADGKPSAEIVALLDDMYETMDAAHGVGLAANQVGVGSRVFVYDCPDLDTEDGEGVSREEVEARGGWLNRRGCVINPVLETSEIPETMPDPEDDLEGCLSVPGIWAPTVRAMHAVVEGVELAQWIHRARAADVRRRRQDREGRSSH